MMAQQPVTPIEPIGGSGPWNPTTGINSYPTLAAVPALSETEDATFNPTTAASTTAATRTLNPDELLSTQLNKVIGQDSALLQQARGNASKAANSRGLLNSSLAVQAGEAAVLDRALPIAQYDAGANTNVLSTNQANTQQSNIFNAGQEQDINKFNTSTATQNSQFNANEANKNSIVNASEQNKILAQFLDQGNKLQLADIEASYRVLMQTEASASTLYQQSVRNISDILVNPDLTPEAKTQAVNNQ
ncbi:MAG: hypothetical protein CTY37_05310, partial [Methylotenera sp.]